MNTEQQIIGGLYRHYKGGEYVLIGIAHHSETLEELVVYQAVEDSEEFGPRPMWIRPKEMFFEDVEWEGEIIPRFRYIK